MSGRWGMNKAECCRLPPLLTTLPCTSSVTTGETTETRQHSQEDWRARGTERSARYWGSEESDARTSASGRKNTARMWLTDESNHRKQKQVSWFEMTITHSLVTCRQSECWRAFPRCSPVLAVVLNLWIHDISAQAAYPVASDRRKQPASRQQLWL